MGLLAAMVQVVPLTHLYMQPVQRCLLGLGLCPQRDTPIQVEGVRLILVASLWPVVFSDSTCSWIEHHELPSGTLFQPFPVGLKMVAWPLRGKGFWFQAYQSL